MDHQNVHKLPPQLHTPTQSFSESPANAPTPDTASSQAPPSLNAAFNEQKSKTELDSAKSRLTDQKFDISKHLCPMLSSCMDRSDNGRIGEFPDPLLPRDAVSARRFMPQGMTPDLEAHLMGVIAKVKESQTATS